MSDVVVWGDGYIGNRIAEKLGCDIIDMHIVDYLDVEDVLNEGRPKVVINCIGNTGGENSDGCEKLKDITLQSNTFVPIYLAEYAVRHRIKLVHISTGCMFQTAEVPIGELSRPDYFDLFYSRSKMYSDQALIPLAKDYNILILRIRIPLDDRPHPKNILTKLLKFDAVIDAPNSVTYIPDFLEAVKFLLDTDARGVFNVVNRGSCRYPALLDEYKKLVPDFEYKIYPFDQFSKDYKRTNLLLSTSLLTHSGFKVRNIREVYGECVSNYVKQEEYHGV